MCFCSTFPNRISAVNTRRDGHEKFFKSLHDQQVPILIFSAGLGDVLNEIIRQRSQYHSNMKTVANFMKFNANVSGCSGGC